MAFAQVYGMAMNGLGFAYLAFVAALVERLFRAFLPDDIIWPRFTRLAVAMLATTPFVVPWLRRQTRPGERTDALITTLAMVLVALLAACGVWLLYLWSPNAIGLPLAAVAAVLAVAVTRSRVRRLLSKFPSSERTDALVAILFMISLALLALHGLWLLHRWPPEPKWPICDRPAARLRAAGADCEFTRAGKTRADRALRDRRAAAVPRDRTYGLWMH